MIRAVRRISLLFVSLVLVASCPGIHADSAELIRIGVVGPMTGQYRAFGQQLKRGVGAAVAALNAAGGVVGREIVIELGDDRCDPERAVSEANRVAKMGIVLVVGHFCGGASIAASGIYEANGIVQISPSTSNPIFTEQGKWNVFRLVSRDDYQARFAGTFIAREYKGKRIAVAHDGSNFGRSIAAEAKKTIEAAGVTVALELVYSADHPDYAGLTATLKKGTPDVLYIDGIPSGGGTTR